MKGKWEKAAGCLTLIEPSVGIGQVFGVEKEGGGFPWAEWIWSYERVEPGRGTFHSREIARGSEETVVGAKRQVEEWLELVEPYE